MKNVAFYLGDFAKSGGTERVCSVVSSALATSENFNIILICTNSQEQKPFFDFHNNVKIVHLNIENPKRQIFSLVLKLANVCKKERIHILVAVEVFTLLFIIPTLFLNRLRSYKFRLIVWEHFNFNVNLGKKLRDWFRKWSARHADAIIVLTKKDKLLWENNLNIRNKILNIYNPNAFRSTELDYNTDSRLIIAVGRLVYQKGFDRLLDIWKGFTDEHKSEWKLKIVGSGKDENELIQKIDSLGLGSSVTLVPSTSDIASIYKSAAFLVMTSRFEGMGLVLIEGQSFGLPLIAYDCLAGPSDIITEGTGFLIEDGDSKDFINKMKRLTSDASLRKKMSDAAKQEVLRFSEDKIITQWEHLLKNI